MCHQPWMQQCMEGITEDRVPGKGVLEGCSRTGNRTTEKPAVWRIKGPDCMFLPMVVTKKGNKCPSCPQIRASHHSSRADARARKRTAGRSVAKEQALACDHRLERSHNTSMYPCKIIACKTCLLTATRQWSGVPRTVMGADAGLERAPARLCGDTCGRLGSIIWLAAC